MNPVEAFEHRLPSVAVGAWEDALKASGAEDSQFDSLQSVVNAGVASASSDLDRINGIVTLSTLSHTYHGDDDVILFGEIHVDGGFKVQNPLPSKEQLRDFAASVGKILRKHLTRDRSIEVKFGRSYYSAWVLSVPVEVQGRGQVRLASMSEQELSDLRR